MHSDSGAGNCPTICYRADSAAPPQRAVRRFGRELLALMLPSSRGVFVRTGRVALASLLLWLSACGTDDPNAFHSGCDHIDAVQVGAGLTPLIAWSPGCAVNKIAVFQALTPEDPGNDPLPVGQAMWEVHASQVAGNTIEPSVRYGQVPGGTSEGVGALPLTAGQPYVVFVSTVALDGPPTGKRRFFTP